MRRILLVVAATAAGAAGGRGQTFVRDLTGIPFFRDSVAYVEPFSGGLNAPMHQFFDADGDGDLDLFILDSDFHRELLFLRNTGTASAPSFSLEPDGGLEGAEFSFWFRFSDYDGDGTAELMTDDGGTGIRAWRNAGTPADPAWSLVAAGLYDTSGAPLFSSFGSLPAFPDLDGNGLPDYLAGNSTDGSLYYYRNIGSPGAPAYVLDTNRLGGIVITSDTCSKWGSPAPAPAEPHHGSGAVSLNDVDGDGDLDVFYGDMFAHGLFLLPNVGTPATPDLDCGSGSFPPGGSLTTPGFNQATFPDIDADGDPDLFVGVLNSRSRGSFWRYANDGAAGAPQYRLVGTEFPNTLDVGQNARPAFADLDGDLDPDLLVGNNDGELWHFVNEGSQLSPVYRLADTAFAGIRGGFSYAPAFGDVDADGDPDLLLGRFDGKVVVYLNEGGGVFSASDSVTTGQYAVPAAGDADGDGDIDLVVGKGNGTLAFFRNTGTPLSAAFTPEDDSYLGVDVGDAARPAFRLNPGTGALDLYVAGASAPGAPGVRSRMREYRNQGPGAAPQFLLADSAFGPPLPFEPAAAFGDPDGDGDDDLLVGTSKGGLVYYRNDGATDAGPVGGTAPAAFRLDGNYPNPFNAVTVIGFELPAAADVRAEVFDVRGRRVALLGQGRRGPGPGRFEWRADRFPSGVYWYRVTADGRSLSRTMLLIR